MRIGEEVEVSRRLLLDFFICVLRLFLLSLRCLLSLAEKVGGL